MLHRSTASVLLAAAVLALGAGPADAQVPTVDTDPTAVATISTALDDVEVDGEAYRAVAADYEAAKAARLAAAARLRSLAVEERSLAAEAARAGARLRLATGDLQRWDRRVRSLAVSAYIGASGDDEVLAAGADPGYTQAEARQALTTQVDRNWRRALDDARAAEAEARSTSERLRRRHTEVVEDQAVTTTARDEALAEEQRLWPTVQSARATATVVGSDLTLVALDAYLRAALEVGADSPSCGLPWWLLAGIGRVESGHGTFSTSTLDPAGTARPAIIGIPLNGSNSTAVITDSDGGTLDGDPVHDRAVGPMQFIPQTWARYAADGNGDGVADPQNLYDAARAAADYLCTAGGDLRTDAGIQRAIFAYNHSQAYVAKVLGFTSDYTGLLV